MIDTIALLALVCGALMVWVGEWPALKLRLGLNNWACWLLNRIEAESSVAMWLGYAGWPALAIGLGGYLIAAAGWFPLLLFDFAVLAGCLALPGHLSHSRRLLDAIYDNDRATAEAIISAWPAPEAAVAEDGNPRFADRLLSHCALKLHQDVLAVLFWYAILGPGGAVLYVGTTLMQSKSRPRFKPAYLLLELPVAWFSIIIFALSGHFSPAISELQSGRPARAALKAGELAGEHLNIEAVPQFSNMLARSVFIGLALSILIIFIFRG